MSTIKADAITASTGTNTNIGITGKGSGKVKLGDGNLLFPDADGAAGTAIVTNGSGTLSFAATGGVETLLETIDASGASTVDLETTFNTTYDFYTIRFFVEGSAPAQLSCRLKVSGSYQTSGYYGHLATSRSSSAAYNGVAMSNAAEINMGAVGTTLGDSQYIMHVMGDPTDTGTIKRIHWAGFASQNKSIDNGGAHFGTAGAITGVRIYAASGTLTGPFSLYGISNS